jgi:hypothetical protein
VLGEWLGSSLEYQPPPDPFGISDPEEHFEGPISSADVPPGPASLLAYLGAALDARAAGEHGHRLRSRDGHRAESLWRLA